VGAKAGSKGAFSEINMTPLIDIVLVVLIGMMINIPIQVNEMGVKLPAKVETPPPQTDNPNQLVIAIYEKEADDKPETLALNRKLISQDNLFFEVTRRLRNMEKKNVFVDAHPKVNYGRVVDMMDLAREAGATKVGLAKLKEAGPASATAVDSGVLPRGVHPGSPSVVGALTEIEADDALKPMMGAISTCYTAGLAQDRNLTGRVMVVVTVGPEGQLMSQKISQSSLSDPAETGGPKNAAGALVNECIGQLLPQFTFQPLGEAKTARVLYPLLFSPG